MELKPCPFCAQNSLYVLRNNHYDDWTVSCATCGANAGCAPTSFGAAAMWNMRPSVALEPTPLSPEEQAEYELELCSEGMNT